MEETISGGSSYNIYIYIYICPVMLVSSCASVSSSASFFIFILLHPANRKKRTPAHLPSARSIPRSHEKIPFLSRNFCYTSLFSSLIGCHRSSTPSSLPSFFPSPPALSPLALTIMKCPESCPGVVAIAEPDPEPRNTEVTLKDLTQKMADFASERDWEKFHSPRNLLLALVGEVGELSEIFQWKGEVPRGLPDWKSAEKEHLGEELSDVLLYLVRLADICEVNLGQAALRKLKKNALKYPVERCKGSSKKYTVYQNGNVEELVLDNTA